MDWLILVVGFLLVVAKANGQDVPDQVKAVEGETRVLECSTTASVVEWRKNGWDTQATLIAVYDKNNGAASASVKPPWDNGDVSIAQVGDVNKLTIKVKHSRDNDITIYCVEVGINRKSVKTFYMEVYIPPIITGLTLDGKSVTGNDVVLRDDTKATLVVIFNAKPSNNPMVTWVTDNTLFGSIFSDTLVIPEGSADRTWDGKVLNCTASTVHGTDSITKNIIVNFGPTISKPTEGQLFPVKEGEEFTLTVEYEAKPDVNKYEWFTPDNAANPNPQHKTNTLTLPNIHRSQAGSYRVRVTNSVSASDVKQFKISVLYGPSADMTKQLSTVTCEVTPGVPTNYNFTFFVQKVHDTIVRNVTYVASKGEYDPTSYQDDGEYSCGVRNEYKGELVGEGVGRVAVNTSSAPFFIKPLTYFLIGEGETKTIPVKFYSVPKYDSVIWTVNTTSTSRDVGEVPVDLPFHGHTISTQAYEARFKIEKATLQSKGKYTLTVTNGAGSIHMDIQVNYTKNATFTPTTPLAPTTETSPTPASDGLDAGLIGGVVGGLLLLIIIVVILTVCVYKKRSRDRNMDNKPSQQNLANGDEMVMTPNEVYDSTTSPSDDGGYANAGDKRFSKNASNSAVEDETTYSTAAKTQNKKKPTPIYPVLGDEENTYSSAAKSTGNKKPAPIYPKLDDENTYSNPQKNSRDEQNTYSNPLKKPPRASAGNYEESQYANTDGPFASDNNLDELYSSTMKAAPPAGNDDENAYSAPLRSGNADNVYENQGNLKNQVNPQNDGLVYSDIISAQGPQPKPKPKVKPKYEPTEYSNIDFSNQ